MAKTLEELKALKKQYQDALSSFGKEALAGIFKPLFDEHPTLTAIRWTQYTPFFNDGETCTFGVNDFYYKVGPATGDSDDEDDGDSGFQYYSPYSTDPDAVKQAAMKAGHEVARTIPDDLMQVVFGDHVKVTATRDGFEVEEYEHE